MYCESICMWMIYSLINYRNTGRIKALISPSVACLGARRRTDRSGGGTLRMRCAPAAPPGWRRNNGPSCLQIEHSFNFKDSVHEAFRFVSVKCGVWSKHKPENQCSGP